MNNVVIKVLNKKHGRRVIEYFKSQGFDTMGKLGNCVNFYYGIIDDKFVACQYPERKYRGFKVIELPEEPTFPRIMMVGDRPITMDNQGLQRVVFMRKNGLYLVWGIARTFEEAEKETNVKTWRYAEDLHKEVTITKSDLITKESELKKLFGIDENDRIKIEL